MSSRVLEPAADPLMRSKGDARGNGAGVGGAINPPGKTKPRALDLPGEPPNFSPVPVVRSHLDGLSRPIHEFPPVAPAAPPDVPGERPERGYH
eukprot:12822707-Heterocapsa_arctica.AAC.1